PGLPRVRPALEDEHVADALFRYGLEVVPHCDFGNAVAVVIVNVEIDGARHVLDDYVALPRWILVPGEFSAALVYHDEVRPAVAVQVGGYKLIAHLQGVSNRGLLPLRQFHARRRRNQQDEQYTQHQPNFTRNGVTKEVALVARLPPVFPTGTEASRGATDIAGYRSEEASDHSTAWCQLWPRGAEGTGTAPLATGRTPRIKGGLVFSWVSFRDVAEICAVALRHPAAERRTIEWTIRRASCDESCFLNGGESAPGASASRQIRVLTQLQIRRG